MKSGDNAPISLERFDNSLKIFDMIYNPPQTALLKEAQKRGMARANGFAMLVWQGARSLEIWSGSAVPAAVMFQAGRKSVVY